MIIIRIVLQSIIASSNMYLLVQRVVEASITMLKFTSQCCTIPFFFVLNRSGRVLRDIVSILFT